MTYTVIKSKINNSKIKYQFTKSDNSKLTYAEFLNLLTSRDNEFLKYFRQVINRASSDLDAREIAHFFWECIPVSNNTLNKEFEFVAVNSPDLKNMRQDYSSFQEHFRNSRDGYVVSFPNLGRDATLVSPVPSRESDAPCSYGDRIVDYKDISNFADNALVCQWNSFWQEVGSKMVESLNNSGGATRWMSTHGLSVKYFHVRICNQPKYYGHQEYLRESDSQNRYNRPQIPGNFQDNYDGWTRGQLIAEINRLKVENEQLRNDQTLTSSERQERLQQNQWRLEKLESAMNTSSQPANEPNKNSLTPLLIGGGILAIIGLVGILIYKKSKQNKRIKNTRK